MKIKFEKEKSSLFKGRIFLLEGLYLSQQSHQVQLYKSLAEFQLLGNYLTLKFPHKVIPQIPSQNILRFFDQKSD